VLADGGTISVVDARTGASPVKLADGVSDTYDWNVEPAVLYRPPTGDQIAYLRRTTSGTVVVLARADGTSPHDILTPADGLAYTDLGGLRWSPDGTRLAMTVYLSSDGLETSVYVVNADGSGLRRASDRAVPGKVVREANPQWSPDGTRIAMQTWFADAEQLDQQETGPIAVVEVASGDTREIGTASVNGFKGWGWSPDGTSIVVVPDAGRVATIDVATGKVHSDAWQSTSGATWQRTAP
jgi:Tol biopolymer transport system component